MKYIKMKEKIKTENYSAKSKKWKNEKWKNISEILF